MIEEQIVYRFARQLDPHPDNPRGALSATSRGMEGLVVSIKAQGLEQPCIISRQLNERGRHWIYAGHRRVLACELAGAEPIMCVERDYTRQQVLEVMITENTQRESLDALEEGRNYAAYLDAGYGTRSDLSRRTGVLVSTISNRVAIARLPAQVGEMFARGELPLKLATKLAKFPDAGVLETVCLALTSRRLTTEAAEAFIDDALKRGELPRRLPGVARIDEEKRRKNNNRPRAGVAVADMKAALAARGDEQVTLGRLVADGRRMGGRWHRGRPQLARLDSRRGVVPERGRRAAQP